MKAQEYGYSQQDFESLSKKYDEDPAIKEKGKKLISERCPGALENMKEDAPQE